MQLWLQTSYFCHLSRPPLIHHEMHTSFAEMYLFHANDGQHLWDRDHSSGSCCVRSAGIKHLVDGLCCRLSQRQSLLDPFRDWEDRFAWFYQPLPAKHFSRQHHARGIRGSNPGTIPYGQRCETKLSCERLSFCNGIWPDLQMDPRDGYSKEPSQPGVLAACPMCLRWRPRCGCLIFSGLDDCAGSGVSLRGSHCWPQFELSQMLLVSVRHWRAWIPVALVIWELWWVPWNAKCQIRQVRWNHDRPWWLLSSLGGALKKSPACVENQRFYQKPSWATVRVQDLCDICAEFYWLRMGTWQCDPQDWEPLPSRVQLQDRTTQNQITFFLELALYVALVLT